MNITDLARQIRLLEIRTDHLVNEVAAGAYRSVFKGRGIEFDEVREYTTDDDVRSIDWNVSARMGSPYIKKFVEERELVVMLAVDLSASGAFGAADKTKRQAAAELAALLAFSAGKNADKTGLMLFTDKIELFLPPRSGRKQALRIIRELLAFEPKGRKTDIAMALKELTQVMKKRGIVFLLSDLADQKNFLPELKLLRSKQDVTVIELIDPTEENFPIDCPVTIMDAESGCSMEFSGNKHRVDLALEKAEKEKQDICRKTGTDMVRIRCDQDIMKPLIGFFSERRKRMRQ